MTKKMKKKTITIIAIAMLFIYSSAFAGGNSEVENITIDSEGNIVQTIIGDDNKAQINSVQAQDNSSVKDITIEIEAPVIIQASYGNENELLINAVVAEDDSNIEGVHIKSEGETLDQGIWGNNNVVRANSVYTSGDSSVENITIENDGNIVQVIKGDGNYVATNTVTAS